MADVQGRWVSVYGVEHHLQIYFSYIIVVSFIGGGNLILLNHPSMTWRHFDHLRYKMGLH
jgi:hypothetical protein